MKKKSIFSVLLVSIVSIGMLAGCGQSTDNKSGNNNKKYTIACDAKFAPFSIEENGTYKGIDVELLDAISKEEGFEYDLKPMDFNGIIPGLVSNQLDGAISAITITDARKQTLDFSDPYFESGLSLVVNKNNTSINSVNDLTNKSASIKKGTAGSKFAEDNKDKYNLTLNYFDDSPSMFQAVENNNADFLVEDYPVIAYKIKVDPSTSLKMVGQKLDTANYGFAVKKGSNKELLDKFNEGLKKLKENGKYDEIVSEYIAK
ncbi:glutamine-binding periplasmic protein precursor [Clostridium saccharobutylicum]|uniref:transporter substrate-binding domain-containing protein n=1 Tax=Clostridium saccharobutylicum TaxID=169679 RepID=UPI000983B7B3|nr:transporter substrate-binding domain-containing protein [Clostridium saccharobutylicum]AQS08657.1 glutamine-binding periplasmic protein precursor [Clostridium saccharobutylicum]NSB89564.1 polar amino acid transport system substrate-binding protein [Clostridium saccharobutylicum]NYC28999.1 polar amino acid transport system substrate-binding protein [Clostridium saccharobutylicum]OOM18523.1 glutamine-binding periplasmic protein precursor [Clostridium saccharobutylicum]